MGFTLSSDGDASDRLHQHVQTILRGGLALSVLLMASGVTLRLSRGLDDAPAVRLFAIGDASDPGLALTAVGILALAMTPALRVIALIFLWWREKDARFVGIALLVLATLILAVLLGKGG